MKKIILLAAIAIITHGVYAQCKFDQFYQEGQKLKFITKTYPENPSLMGAIMSGAKPKKVAAMVEERRELMEKGKNPPTITEFEMTVEAAVYDAGEGQIVYVSYEMPDGSGKNISATGCDGDILLIHRNINKAPAPDAPGFYVNGVQNLPVVIEIGDVLQSYEDTYVAWPKTVVAEVKTQVVDKIKKVNEFTGQYMQKEVGGQRVAMEKWKQGYETTYKEVTVALEKTVRSKTHAVNYAESAVKGKETLSVDGKQFEAYVIESKQWVKNATDVEYKSSNKALAKSAQKADNKTMQKIMDEALENMKAYGQEVTEGGYIVNTIKEWYVPGIGILKTQTYDPYNILTSETTLTSVN